MRNTKQLLQKICCAWRGIPFFRSDSFLYVVISIRFTLLYPQSSWSLLGWLLSFFKFFFYTWLLFSLSFVLFFPWNLRQFSTLQKIRHSFAVRLLTMVVFVFSLQCGVQQNERLHGLPHEGLLERPTGGRKPSQNDH